MEKTHSCECHSHTVFIRALNNEIVADRSAGLCYVFYTALLSALNIVAEGEERIRSERNSVKRYTMMQVTHGLSHVRFAKGLPPTCMLKST